MSVVPAVSVVMPCLNEEKTLGACIEEIRSMELSYGIPTEIIVADNGSSDNSIVIAQSYGCKVINVPIRGYGAAINAGILNSTSEYVIIADADSSYNFLHTPNFLTKLQEGNDLVIGNRFLGGIEKNAMPWLHKYIGNPVLSHLARILFKINISDFHCGMRGVRKSKYKEAGPVTTGMEFATEMVIRMSNRGFLISEIPTELRKDGRDRKPHLRSFPDGWRHLKLMLLYSPDYLQIYPGLILLGLGLFGNLSYILFGFVPLLVGRGTIQTGLISILSISVGIQLYLSGILNKEYAREKGLVRLSNSPRIQKILRSQALPIAAVTLITIGASILIGSINLWRIQNFEEINPFKISRSTYLAFTLQLIGAQLLIASLQLRQYATKFW